MNDADIGYQDISADTDWANARRGVFYRSALVKG
jgi:hypothetical protein